MSLRRPRYSPASAAVAELPSTSPAAPSACTATYGPTVPAGTGIAVSKPLRGTCATVARLEALAPVSSLQALTSVAPFQLAYTVVPVGPPARRANAGGCAGVPVHAKRNAR